MTMIHRREALRLLAAGAATPLLSETLAVGADEEKDPYADGKLIDGEPPKPGKGSFTIAVLPDTQHYSEKFPDTYLTQTRWIVEKQKERSIACVLHLGDITNRNTEAEWKNAHLAMKELDGKVPYFFVPGNHDYSKGGGCKDRTTLLNDYFKVKDYRDRPTFGGVYDKEPSRLENSYHRFSAGGRDFLVLCLEFGPRTDVVRWANEIVKLHPKREVILNTHAFIYYDDTRYNWTKYGEKQKWNPHAYGVAKEGGDDVHDGEELWKNLVSKYGNFILTLNGHVLGDGLGKVTSKAGGREIPQVLVNYQMRPKGGDGWLRLLEFLPNGKTVEVYDYSPTRQQRNEGPQNRFGMKIAGIKG